MPLKGCAGHYVNESHRDFVCPLPFWLKAFVRVPLLKDDAVSGSRRCGETVHSRAQDYKMPVLDAGLYEGLLSKEAFFAALSDSSLGIAGDDGLRFRTSSGWLFRTWLATSQSGSSVCFPGRRPSRTRWQIP